MKKEEKKRNEKKEKEGKKESFIYRGKLDHVINAIEVRYYSSQLSPK